MRLVQRVKQSVVNASAKNQAVQIVVAEPLEQLLFRLRIVQENFTVFRFPLPQKLQIGAQGEIFSQGVVPVDKTDADSPLSGGRGQVVPDKNTAAGSGPDKALPFQNPDRRTDHLTSDVQMSGKSPGGLQLLAGAQTPSLNLLPDDGCDLSRLRLFRRKFHEVSGLLSLL